MEDQRIEHGAASHRISGHCCALKTILHRFVTVRKRFAVISASYGPGKCNWRNKRQSKTVERIVPYETPCFPSNEADFFVWELYRNFFTPKGFNLSKTASPILPRPNKPTTPPSSVGPHIHIGFHVPHEPLEHASIGNFRQTPAANARLLRFYAHLHEGQTGGWLNYVHNSQFDLTKLH